MTGTEELEAIRARHEVSERAPGWWPNEWSAQVQADRATLLPLAERCLRAEARVAELEGREAKVKRLVEAALCQMTVGGKHNFLNDIHKIIGGNLLAPKP